MDGLTDFSALRQATDATPADEDLLRRSPSSQPIQAEAAALNGQFNIGNRPGHTTNSMDISAMHTTPTDDGYNAELAGYFAGETTQQGSPTHSTPIPGDGSDIQSSPVFISLSGQGAVSKSASPVGSPTTGMLTEMTGFTTPSLSGMFDASSCGSSSVDDSYHSYCTDSQSSIYSLSQQENLHHHAQHGFSGHFQPLQYQGPQQYATLAGGQQHAQVVDQSTCFQQQQYLLSHHPTDHNPFSVTRGSRYTPPGRSQMAGGCSKPKRKRIINKQQRSAANIRERRRMTTLNDAFEGLRERVPTFSYEKKLSRIETLKLALMYIRFMTDVVNGKGSVGDDLEKVLQMSNMHQHTKGMC